MFRLSCFLNSWKTFQKIQNLTMRVGILSAPIFFLFTAKDKLFNDVVSKLNFEFLESHVYMNTDVDIVVSVLWYLDGSREKIMERSKNNSAVKPRLKRWHFLKIFRVFSFCFYCVTSFIWHVAICLIKDKRIMSIPSKRYFLF